MENYLAGFKNLYKIEGQNWPEKHDGTPRPDGSIKPNDQGNGYERCKVTPAEAVALAAQGTRIAIRVCEEALSVVDIDAHDGNTAGLEQLEVWKQQHPEFLVTRSERTKSGGFHYYFLATGKRLNKRAFASVDIMDGHQNWCVVAPSPGYEVINDTMNLQPLPEALQQPLITDLDGNRGLSMPALIKPLDAERPVITDPDIHLWDWNSKGGRGDTLFSVIGYAFSRASGTPDERMGKALWLADDVIQGIHTGEKKFRSIEDFWDNNRGLSVILDKEEAAQAAQVDPSTLALPRGRAKAKQVVWLPGQKLAEGLVCMLVAPTKVGKTTFTFGHLIPEAVKSGMRLIVISDETNETATYAYAYAHGYGDADIRNFSSDEPEDDAYKPLHNYVMGQAGLYNTIKAALALDSGSPAVLVIESPEDHITEADGVKFIGNSNNIEPTHYKALVTRIQNELIAPGGHAVIWSTHTAYNDADAKARGGAAGMERARMLYKMHGSLENEVIVTARGNVYVHPDGTRKFYSRVRPTPFDAKRQAASDAGVSINDAMMPQFVFDALEPAFDTGVPSISLEGLETGEHLGSEILEMLGLEPDRSPGRRIASLQTQFRSQGWSVEIAGKKYRVSRIADEGDAA